MNGEILLIGKKPSKAGCLQLLTVLAALKLT